MTKLHPDARGVNSLASTIDPSSPLDAAEALLAAASLFHAHGDLCESRRTLGLASSALHLASLLGTCSPHSSLLTQAVREAEAQLNEAMTVFERRSA